MMSKHAEREMWVKQHLKKLKARDERNWDVMLDLLNRRAFRDQLVRIRKEKGIAQSDLAEALQVTQATLSEWETEQWPNPKVSTLARWGSALGVRVDVYAEDKSLPEPDEEPEDSMEPGRWWRIIAITADGAESLWAESSDREGCLTQATLLTDGREWRLERLYDAPRKSEWREQERPEDMSPYVVEDDDD